MSSFMFHLHLENHRKLLSHTWRNVASSLLLVQQQLISGLLVLLSGVTCFIPLSNSSELMSNSKYRSTRYMMTLQRIHVIGSGMPTTEIAGGPPELPGGPSAPGCELNSLCFWPANTNLRTPNLRPCAPGCPVKGRAGRTHIPAHCRCTVGCLLQVGPLFQAQTPGEHATRPPSSRHAARLVIRCIRARRARRYRRRLNHGPGLKQPPLS